MRKFISLMACVLAVNSSLVTASTIQESISAASVGEHRSAKNIARNEFRHPVKTLSFFGLEADMKVLEISPGGLWYAEILAPLLKESGEYIAAAYDTAKKGLPSYQYRLQAAMEKRFKEQADVFGAAKIVKFSPPHTVELGKDSSVDMVVTFRNSHGWLRDGIAASNYQAFFDVIKPGGVLGVVQHRANQGTVRDADNFTGYVTEAEIINLAVAAGFLLEASSEINANSLDTKNHPKGVWTLPPSYRLKDKDRAMYAAMGESDRMTLRFRKPAK